MEKLGKENGRYVEAMGYQHWRTRPQFQWWDYESLISSPKITGSRSPSQPPSSMDDLEVKSADPIDQWVLWASTDKSLNRLLRDAGIYRSRYLRAINEEYGINTELAGKMMKTFVGYHPSYGGYITQIGPYVSSGGGHGISHVKESGKTKFASFVLPRKRATADDIRRALAKNIEEYNKAFGITFAPEDFGLKIMGPAKEEYDPSRQRAERRVVEEFVPTLDETNPETQNFIARSPMVSEGSQIDFNANGWEKILTEMMGPWYSRVLRDKARAENKTVAQVGEEALRDMSVLKDMYDKTLQKWEEAKISGEAAALGIPPPPKFKSTNRGRFGAQGFSPLTTNDLMSKQMALKIEILEFLKDGLTDPTEIADRLNADPARKAANYRLKYKGKDPIIISPEEVQRHILQVNHEAQRNGKNISNMLDDAITTSNEMLEATGYSDLKTAMEMASIHFSTETTDVISGTRMGPSNAVAFIPSDDLENFTSEELRKAKESMLRGEPVSSMPLSPESKTVSPEQIKEDVGDLLPSEKATQEEKEEVKPKPKSKPVPQRDMAKELEYLMGSTIKNLIKVAEELDLENKDDEAEEVHKVIRKYVEKL